jgi:anti-sigma28 factor (negative regulator of flagellin synthesis)
MQLSDREIQNTIDLLKKRKLVAEEDLEQMSKEEVEGIADLVKKMEAEPEVRKERVEKVRRAMRESGYNVTGDEVAKKMIGRIFSDKLR